MKAESILKPSHITQWHNTHNHSITLPKTLFCAPLLTLNLHFNQIQQIMGKYLWEGWGDREGFWNEIVIVTFLWKKSNWKAVLQ